jgi:hypothetical protein
MSGKQSQAKHKMTMPPALLSMFDDEDDDVEITKQLPKLTFDDAALAAAAANDDGDNDGDGDGEIKVEPLPGCGDSDTSTRDDESLSSDDDAAKGKRSPSPLPPPTGSSQPASDAHLQPLAAVKLPGGRRPRGDTKIIAVSEAEADNVFLAHLDDDDDESELASASSSKSVDGFHQRPLNASGTATPARPLSIQISTNSCLRCKIPQHTVKMSLKVGHPVEHFQLMNFCTLCAIAVQSDKVEAAKMANGDVAKAIAERASQAPLRKQCEKCKKRVAHTITNWGKTQQRVLTCAVCITEHKDFKVLAQYALSCVVNLDFNAARQSFLECLQMSPDNAQVYYNLACVESLTRHAELGLKLLRAALSFGYANWKQVTNDEDLARVRALPEFADLVAEFKGPKSKLKSPR